MKPTEKELALYQDGKLRLFTDRKTGESKLVPSKGTSLDRGITSKARRAYYRVWYLRNRAKRLKHEAGYKLSRKAVMVRVKSAAPKTEAAKKKAYMATYRAKNLKKIRAQARAMYHAKYSTRAKRENAALTAVFRDSQPQAHPDQGVLIRQARLDAAATRRNEEAQGYVERAPLKKTLLQKLLGWF